MYDYIKYSASTNAKNINGYINKGEYYERHITDQAIKDKVFMISKTQFEKCVEYFWNSSLIGKVGKQQEQVYAYVDKKKLFLNRLLTNTVDEKDKRIIFKNRNCFDYRDENLSIISNGDKHFREVPRKGKELPSGISAVKQKDRKQTGYVVVDNEGKQKYFGIRKLKTLDNCLEEAKKYLESLKKIEE
jgi:hypothetical protein